MIDYKKKYLKYKKKYIQLKKLYGGSVRSSRRIREKPDRYLPSEYLPIEKKKKRIKIITKKNVQKNIDGRPHLLPWIDSCTRVFAIWTHRALKYHWKLNPKTQNPDDSNSIYYILQHWESHIDSFICYNEINYGTDIIMEIIDEIINEYLKNIYINIDINIDNESDRFKYFCKEVLPNNTQCLSSIYNIIYDDDGVDETLDDVKLAYTLSGFFSLLSNTMNMLINFEKRYTDKLVVHASTFCSGKDKEGGHIPVLLNECPCCSNLKELCLILDNWKEQEEETSLIIEELMKKISIDIEEKEEDDWEPEAIEYIKWQWFEDDMNPRPFNTGKGPISFYVEQAWEDIGFGHHIDLTDIELMDEDELDELVDGFYGFKEDEYIEQWDYEQGQGWDRDGGPIQANDIGKDISDVWEKARIGY